MTQPRVLVAGIGNVFLGDDGFGVEVVRRLVGGREASALPRGVDVVDYGIRGLHLAYDLLDGRHAVLVLVDALPLDEPPGTLAVLDVDLDGSNWEVRPEGAAPAADAHGMDPESVLRLLRSLGGRIDRVLVVGCRPAVLDERMELSAPVRAALDEAVRTVVSIARNEAARLAARACQPSLRRDEEAAKQRAPTRPHAPDHPPALTLAVPVVASYDRLRDRLQGRPRT